MNKLMIALLIAIVCAAGVVAHELVGHATSFFDPDYVRLSQLFGQAALVAAIAGDVGAKGEVTHRWAGIFALTPCSAAAQARLRTKRAG